MLQFKRRECVSVTDFESIIIQIEVVRLCASPFALIDSAMIEQMDFIQNDAGLIQLMEKEWVRFSSRDLIAISENTWPSVLIRSSDDLALQRETMLRVACVCASMDST